MRSRAIVAILLAAVVNAAGCGGTQHDTVSPRVLLDSAAAHPITSADTDTDLQLVVRGIPQLSAPLSVHLSGPYVSGGGRTIPKFDWRLNASAIGFPVGGHLVSTGSNVYLTIYRDTYEVGADAVAAANERVAAAPALNTRSWLGHVRIDGEGNEGGVDCERITAPLRGEVMAQDLEPYFAELGLTGRPSISGRAIACIGFDDRVLHEIEIGAALGIPAADRAVLHGASSIGFHLDVTLSDVGKPQQISTPHGGGIRPIRDLAVTLNDLGVPVPL
jgi:hypothetical protein